MLILKMIISLVVFFVVPTILGMIITKFTDKKYNLLFYFVFGYLIEFATLQIIAIPMIFFNFKFITLLIVWIILILALMLLSIIINKSIIKEFKKIKAKEVLKKCFNKSNIIGIVAIILILIQAIYPIFNTYTNEDDAFFVGTATTTIYENSMYKVSAEDGGIYGQLPSRYILAPFSMYLAVISSIINISPAIVAHSIFPPVFIILAYAVYTLLAEKLLGKDRESISIFIILLSIINIFGNYSDRTNFTYLLLRIWQGKAILAGIMLPAIWYAFLNYVEDDKKVINWVIMFITILATLLVSEMSIALAPMTLMLLAVVFSIRDKKISYLLKSVICVIPSIIYFCIYLFIK